MQTNRQAITTGILDMIIASVSFGAMTGFVKFASVTVPTFEIVFLRGVLGSLMMIAVIYKQKESFIGRKPGLLLARGVFGFIALATNFYAISKLNLGTAVVLNYTSPIFVALIAVLLLREKISSLLWTLTLMCFIGVYLLVGFRFSSESFPILIGLFSGMMAGFAYITISLAGEEESSNTIIFYFTVVTMIGSLPLLHYGFKALNLMEWVAILGIAITSFFGQVYLTKSIREAPASIVCPFSYVTPVVSFILGILFWKDPFTARTVIGTLLVVASGALIYLFESRPEPITE